MKSLTQIKLFAALIFALSLVGNQAFSQPLTIAVTFDSVSCQGASDATAYVSAINNGTPPYTYEWYDGGGKRPETVDSIYGLTGGNYTCLVRDNSIPMPQVATQDFTIHEPNNINIIDVSTTDTDCYDDSTGSVFILATQGTIPRKFSIDNGATFQASPFFMNQPAGNYTVVVSDKNNCDVSYGSNPVTIDEPAELQITNPVITDIDCFGDDDGAISVTTTGGTTPYDFLWSGPGGPYTTEDITNLAPGGYSLDVTDILGCSASNGLLTVVEAPEITINNIVATDELCFNDGNGTVTITASGGTGTLDYTLTPGAFNNQTGSFINLSSNTYTISIIDDNLCGPVVQGGIVVDNPLPISILSEDTTSITCNAADDGTISVRGEDGTAPYDYTLYLTPATFVDNNATGDFINLGPGSPSDYYVSVTDANTCPAVNSSSWLFEEPAALTLDAIDTNDVTCSGAGDGSIVVNASGGTGSYIYTLTPGGSQASGTFSGLTGGTYQVSVVDSKACAGPSVTDLFVNDPLPIEITFANKINITCTGAANGQIVIMAQNGTAPLKYILKNPTIPIDSNYNGTFSSLPGGIYSVDVTDTNRCGPENSGNLNLTDPLPLNISFQDTTSITCNGNNDGTITIVASGGTLPRTYTLTPGTYPANATGSFTGLIPADGYQVSVTDVNGCPPATSNLWDFKDPGVITITPLDTNDVTCNGAGNGSLSVSASGGTSPYTYTLTPGSSQASGDFIGLSGGTYSVNVTDSRTCPPAVVGDMLVNDPAPITINNINTNDVSCSGLNDGSIIVTASGGTDTLFYTLTPGAIKNTDGNFTGLAGNTYSLSITDVNACTPDTASGLFINDPLPISIDNEDSTGISCNGADDAYIDITASGGTGVLTFILKNPADVDTNTTGLFTGLPPGTYTVEVDDSNACGPVISNPFTFNEPGPVNVTVDGSSGKVLTCYGDSTGSLNITVTGGYSPFAYSWSGPNGFASPQKNISGLKAGDYNLTITDANGCSRIYTPLDSVTGPPEFLMSVTSKNSSCFGVLDDTVWVNASGGTPPYLYDDGFGQQVSNIFTGLGPGTHTLEVIDVNACTISDTVSIVMPQPLDIVGENVVDSQQKCNGDSNGVIVITATGGTGLLEYSIDSGYTFTPNNTFAGLGGGTYYSAVKDQNGCIVFKSSLLISNPPVLYIDKYAQDDILTCFDAAEGEARIKAAGGTPFPGVNPFIYVMDLVDTSLDGRFPNLIVGNHDIDIYDANGCTTDTSILIISPPPITISTVITHVTSCYEDSAGMIAIIASGGTGLTKGYIFQADSTFSTDTVFYDSLPGGNYDFTVIDSLGCEVYPSAVVNAPDSIAYDSVTVLPVSCFGDTDGEIMIYGSGGTPSYFYILNPGADTNTTGMYSNLAPGDYIVKIGDSHGCKPCTTPLLTVPEPPLLVFDSSASTNISCGGMSDGIIAIYASGGQPPYTYSVDTGGSFGSAGLVTGLGPGTYIIIVQDSAGCSVVGDTITLVDPPGLSLDPPSHTDVSSCFGDSTGAISVSSTGGTGALEYSLDSVSWQASGTFPGLPAGIYTAVVRDSKSCLSAFPPDTIGEPPPISATITTATAMIPDPGSISISASGGTPPLEYSIDSGANFSADTFYLVVSDIYGVVVRDANLCTYEESVTVPATPPLEVSVSSTDIDCNNNNNGSIVLAHLNGIGTVSYSIDGGASSQSSGDYTGLTGSMYYIHVADSHRIYRDTIEIINPPAFSVIETITPATCSRNSFDGSILLSVSGATPPYVYLWSNDSTTKDISGLEERNYRVNITDSNNCQYTNTYSVPATDSLRADAGGDTTVCYGNPVTLNGSGGDEFTWSPEEGLSRIDIPNPTTIVTDSVSYVLFTRNLASGCADRDTVILNVYPDRGISAGQDTTVAPGQTITLTAAGGSFASYRWLPEDGLDNPAGQTTAAIISSDITYTVTGTTEFGCTESDSMSISVATGLLIYSGFTPNGDGINDLWDIDYIVYYPNATIKVFDRWGKTVFSSVGYADNQRWDGRYKGKDLPIGTYYYVIDL